jgi:hypothetical protein
MSSVHKFRTHAAITTLAVALAAPAASFGVSYDINRESASFYGAETGAILPDGTGDSVLYPFYTTVNGATTTFSLTNTSVTATVAAKVRFRDSDESTDQLDFIVVMSPEDKFNFFVAQNSAGTPTAYWFDNSCVVGYPGAVTDELKELPFTGTVSDGTGHMEVIGMLNLNTLESGTGVDLDEAASHSLEAGKYVPRDCDALKRAFESRAAVNGIRGEAGGPALSTDLVALGEADVPNVLTGSMLLTIPGTGVEAGTDAIMVRNTFNRGFLAAQSTEACAEMGDPGTNQGYESCYSLYNWDMQEFDHPNLADINWVGDGAGDAGTNTVAVLDQLLTAQALQGDWSNNALLNVGTDWIVTFPTKYVYFNGGPCNLGDKVVGYSTGCGITPFPDKCVNNRPIYVQGNEEETTTIASPADPFVSSSCYEVGVYTFSNSNPRPINSRISTNREILEFSDSLKSVNGWAQMSLEWNNNAVVPTHVANFLNGAAVAPLLWTIRATASPTENNGSLRGLSRFNDIDALVAP